MPEVMLPGGRFSYDMVGDGFPLVLAPGPQGRRDVWSQYMPLLGELCRAIAYECHETGLQPGEPHTSPRAADTLETFLEVLGLERVYLASLSVGWPMALHFALQHPASLEGLVLIGAHDVEMDTVRGVMSLQARLHEITVPTLVLLEAQVRTALPYAEVLAERLPHCTQIVVSDATLAPLARVPALRLGHTMMGFLLHCERQRHLVRGASFLL